MATPACRENLRQSKLETQAAMQENPGGGVDIRSSNTTLMGGVSRRARKDITSWSVWLSKW
jgi:hypothetical protein